MRSCAIVVLAACGSAPSPSPTIDAPVPPGDDAAPPAENRDRLLATYLAYLQAHPGAQSNGLDGAQLHDVCELWGRLAPSPQATFLTLTARLAGGHLDADGSSLLDHLTTLYKVVGGDGATASDPGSCGGGDANRAFFSMDATLHDALRAAFTQKGGTAQRRLIPDVVAASFWRDSHDAGGTHAPFDESDETEGGAPRGQVQFFADPASAVANAPLGRPDLASLVDPHALEMDQDYDCFHASNPLCSYTLYGALCAPMPSATGVAIYGASYGAVDLAWRPAGC